MNADAEKKKQLVEVLTQLRTERDRLDGIIRTMERVVYEPRNLYYRDARQLDLFDLVDRDEA
jgi:hypothetical protein